MRAPGRVRGNVEDIMRHIQQWNPTIPSQVAFAFLHIHDLVTANVACPVRLETASGAVVTLISISTASNFFVWGDSSPHPVDVCDHPSLRTGHRSLCVSQTLDDVHQNHRHRHDRATTRAVVFDHQTAAAPVPH